MTRTTKQQHEHAKCARTVSHKKHDLADMHQSVRNEEWTDAVQSVLTAFVDIAFEVSAPQLSERAANLNQSIREIAEEHLRNAA